MRQLAVALAACLAIVAPAAAFDGGTQAVIDRAKKGKLMPIEDIATLMMASERWCYFESNGTCNWSDIYLARTDTGVRYEVSNAWDARYDISLVDEGEFKDGRYICEIAGDWTQTVRASWREDGAPVGGRELEALREEIRDVVDLTSADCFDYVLQSTDAEAQTITLLQRQYDAEGNHNADNDAPVTLHFDPESAKALTWAWNY